MLALVGKSFQPQFHSVEIRATGKQSQVPADPSTSEVPVCGQRKQLRHGTSTQEKGDSWCLSVPCPQLSNSVAWKTICRPGNHDSVKCGSATKEWELPGRRILPPVPPCLPASTSTLPLVSRFSQALQKLPLSVLLATPHNFPNYSLIKVYCFF